MLPPGRVRTLASEAKRRAAWEIARLAPARRHALLLVFISEMFTERGDELIDRYCAAVQSVERRARVAVKDERDETARERDQRSQLAGTLSRILLDALEGGEDPLMRALREVGLDRLRECVADPPRSHERSTNSAATPNTTAVPTWRSSRPRCSRRSTSRPRAGMSRCSTRSATATPIATKPHLPDAPLSVLPASWRQWTLDAQGHVTRTRFEVALWIRTRDALRARGLYRASSHRYGDPAAWMMPRAQWQRERAELAVIFDRPLDANERLGQLEREQRRLVQALQDGYDRGERVLFDGQRLTGEPPGERQTRESKIASLVPAMLPTVQFAEILIDVHRDLSFLDELQHYGQGARSPARQGQIVAALLADIFGVSYAQMALACGFTERQMREAAQRHLTEENLDAANTVIVQALRLMPHEWIAELRMTSSDAQRYEIIGRSPIGSFAARHTGHRHRMLSWLLWLTGEYAHFGGKIISVTEPESWHTLDALVHFDGPPQHTTDTHGTTGLTFGIADLLGRDFVPRLDDFTARRRYRIGDAQPWLAADALLTHTARRELIREQYEELQRIAGSIERGWIIPSVLITRMASDPRPDRTGKALREYGRVIETNHILRWAGDPLLRQRSHQQLNRKVNANALRRALAHGNRGRVRARDPELAHRQFEARRLGANATHYWNTKYIALIFDALDRLGIELGEAQMAGVTTPTTNTST